MSASSFKRLYIVRHGQAAHNPRAEVAKANGCSMEEFLNTMREDDVLDAELTSLGRKQASSAMLQIDVDLVVSSPLSRALETADLIHPPSSSPRVCCEAFREVNGDMLNAKRLSKTLLEDKFPAWDFQDLKTDHDGLWTSDMEKFEDTAERGYQGLSWLMDRKEDSILLVSHGGILRYMMNIHPLVSLRDDRKNPNGKTVESRFDNCEGRQYILSWNDDERARKSDDERRKILLTQVDH